jgi:hypothetical protein
MHKGTKAANNSSKVGKRSLMAYLNQYKAEVVNYSIMPECSVTNG